MNTLPPNVQKYHVLACIDRISTHFGIHANEVIDSLEVEYPGLREYLTTKITDLPVEILHEIAFNSGLSAADVLNLGLTNTSFHNNLLHKEDKVTRAQHYSLISVEKIVEEGIVDAIAVDKRFRTMSLKELQNLYTVANDKHRSEMAIAITNLPNFDINAEFGGNGGVPDTPMIYATRRGNIDVVKDLSQRGVVITQNVFIKAIHEHHITLVKWMLSDTNKIVLENTYTEVVLYMIAIAANMFGDADMMENVIILLLDAKNPEGEYMCDLSENNDEASLDTALEGVIRARMWRATEYLLLPENISRGIILTDYKSDSLMASLAQNRKAVLTNLVLATMNANGGNLITSISTNTALLIIKYFGNTINLDALLPRIEDIESDWVSHSISRANISDQRKLELQTMLDDYVATLAE